MPQNRMSGNKGEWSELYVLFRLLSEGRVFAADKDAQRIAEIYYPIVKVIREEKIGSPIEYVINREKDQIDVVVGGVVEGSVPKTVMGAKASDLLYEINANKNSFELTEIEDFANGILVYKIKAPSSDKTDIKMRIEDLYTNTQQDVGFSIKSELGHAPTLLNASRATNFTFTVKGLMREDIERINGIETRSKIRDRIGAIYAARGSFTFLRTANETFDDNLVMIDSRLPEIIANALEIYYSRDISSLAEIAEILAKENPCRYRRPDVYGYKIRKMLCACALGMKPSAIWDGREEANGGYILVKGDGEILAYHIYNREAFELYLLENTSLERASTTRHDYMHLFDEEGETRINLNLQIRFK